MGFPVHIIDLIQNLYRKQQSAVRSAAGMTEWFKIGRGVRQGCILSTREALDGYNKGFRTGGRGIRVICDMQMMRYSSPLYPKISRN